MRSKLLTYAHSTVVLIAFAIGAGFFWHLGASLAFAMFALIPLT